jgi:hypothetical protein
MLTGALHENQFTQTHPKLASAQFLMFCSPLGPTPVLPSVVPHLTLSGESQDCNVSENKVPGGQVA